MMTAAMRYACIRHVSNGRARERKSHTLYVIKTSMRKNESAMVPAYRDALMARNTNGTGVLLHKLQEVRCRTIRGGLELVRTVLTHWQPPCVQSTAPPKHLPPLACSAHSPCSSPCASQHHHPKRPPPADHTRPAAHGGTRREPRAQQ